jgi:tetratricopeptide (TPR) repeat protein
MAKRKSNKRNIIGYLFFLCTLTLLTFVYFFTTIFNTLGEVAFLRFHKNEVAYVFLQVAVNNPFINSKNYQENIYYTHFLLARIYFVDGDLESAIKEFNIARDYAPEVKEIYYGLGLTYGYAPNIYLDYAEYNFKKYIDLEQKEYKETGRHDYGAWAGYNDLSWIYYQKGDYKQAEDYARQGLEVSSGNPWLLNSLGVVLTEQERCTEALPYLKEAKQYADATTASEFGEAYTGDDSSHYESGLNSMKNLIEENISLCENPKM